MGGTVTMVTAGGVTASITDARGTTTTANDWILTSEPGDVTITDPIVYRAGLFGLDLDSNTHVIGGVVEETSQRGLMIGRDLGGRLHNATVTGLTIKNTGLPAGMVGGGVSEPQGITWGTTFPGLTVEIENVVLSATSVLDTRGVPLTALGMNVDLDHGRYNAVIVDTSAPLFGATKSYNTFGSNWPDPHLDGSPTALLLDQNMLVCYAGNTNLGRPAAANVWIEYRGGQYMWITWNVGVTDGTGCAGADNFAVSLPTPFIIGPWLRAPLLGDMVGGGVLSGFCDPGATACRVTLASALSTGQSLTLSGTLHVATP
jgi:hypothetical protein